MQFHTERMIESHPSQSPKAFPDVAPVIVACLDCAQACTTCADACLNEVHVDRLIRCIRLNLDCADVCETTGRILSRLSDGGDDNSCLSLIQACAAICRACGEECRRHAKMHEHCRVCGEACQACEEACGKLLSSVRH